MDDVDVPKILRASKARRQCISYMKTKYADLVNKIDTTKESSDKDLRGCILEKPPAPSSRSPGLSCPQLGLNF